MVIFSGGEHPMSMERGYGTHPTLLFAPERRAV